MAPELLVPVIGVFLALAFVFGAIVMLVLQRTSIEQKRLRAVSAGGGPSLVLEQPQLVEELDPRLQKLSRALPRSPKDMVRLRRHLAAAGYYSFMAAVLYSLAELVLPLILGGALLWWLGWADGWLFGGLAAILGYLFPGLWLQHKTTLRRKAIQNGLPDPASMHTMNRSKIGRAHV